ncbi:hypothetical protein [Pantoea agglomerans]|nr:hypothetical protein [Pantoea agglomerans]
MTVKPAVCQSGFPHHFCDSNTVYATAAHSSRSDFDDSIVACRFVCF